MGWGTTQKGAQGRPPGGDDLSGILKDKMQWAAGSGGKRVVQAVRETRSTAVQQGQEDLWQIIEAPVLGLEPCSYQLMSP